MRAVGDADNEAASGGAAFLDIRRSVADFCDVLRIGDAGQLHSTVNEMRMRPPVVHFIACHTHVHDVAVPSESRKQDIEDLAAESGVEGDVDAGFAQPAEDGE